MFSMNSGRRMLKNTGMALGLATTLFAGTAALAGPASAGTVTARLDSGRILVNGSTVADGIDIDINTAGTVVTVSNTLGAIAAGPGCTQAVDEVKCPTVGIDRIDVFGDAGGDSIRNDTNLPSTLSGDNGIDTVHGGSRDDILFGGFGDDTLTGNGGTDRINGGIGTDRCNGEIEVSCEL